MQSYVIKAICDAATASCLLLGSFLANRFSFPICHCTQHVTQGTTGHQKKAPMHIDSERRLRSEGRILSQVHRGHSGLPLHYVILALCSCSSYSNQVQQFLKAHSRASRGSGGRNALDRQFWSLLEIAQVAPGRDGPKNDCWEPIHQPACRCSSRKRKDDKKQWQVLHGTPTKIRSTFLYCS